MNIKNVKLKKPEFFKNYFFILVLSLFILSCKGPDGNFKIPSDFDEINNCIYGSDEDECTDPKDEDSDGDNLDESVKISIRFLTNEVRSDALDIKVFNRKCNNVSNCIISEVNDELAPELKKQILKKATLYKEEAKEKDKK